MRDAIEFLRKALRGLNTGRARRELLEPVRVEAYGNTIPLEQVACVYGGDARTLRVAPFDPSLVGAIVKAIHKANLGLNPQAAGGTILVVVPAPDQEQRQRLEARAKALAEDTRIALRNVRKDERNGAKREGGLEKITKRLEALTKASVGQVEEMLEAKIESIDWSESLF